MNIISIDIHNYRSIKKLSIPITTLPDGTLTFGLIGVNEAGKSSILKAIALANLNNKPILKDFQNISTPIVIVIKYDLTEKYSNELQAFYSENHPEIFEKSNDFDHVSILYRYHITGNEIVGVCDMFVVDTEGERYEISPEIAPLSSLRVPIFWAAEEKYLISEPINIDLFAADSDNISVPLKNCFKLAGYEDIPNAISNLVDSTDIAHLQDCLSRAVTEHISKVWPGHPVQISFQIYDRKINFHIKDEGSLAKAKTTAQRSDGFKQFISFLLTVSAESKNEKLNNRILLIDEPETHLHPKAQLYFLNELKEITKKNTNNIVFFATHSTFMIDKSDLSRNFRVLKKGDETTIEKFDKESITYNAVNFEVFEIYSTDYHNELYVKLHAKFQEDNVDDLTLKHIKSFDEKFFHLQHKLKKIKNANEK
jgi:AAA15 family ATPase/GTPase